MPTSKESPEPRQQPVAAPAWPVELAKSVLPSAATLIAISGGLIYAAVALGYQDFYGTFGLAPSDVGITQSGIVAQTAVAMAEVGTVVLLLWLVLYLIAPAPVVCWRGARSGQSTTLQPTTTVWL